MPCHDVQERNVYKAKWQQLLGQHTSAHTTIERLQRDMQQRGQAYADLQKVNHALESRLLGHRSDPSATCPALVLYSSHSPAVFATAASDSSDGIVPDWQPHSMRSSPVRNSPGGAGGASAHTYRATQPQVTESGPGGGPTTWGDSTTHLDSILAEQQHRASSSSPAAQQSSVTATAACGSGGMPSLSSNDIMARLTRSPGATSPLRPYSNMQQTLPGLQQPSISGLQSPPDTDGPMPARQLRTALFGNAQPQAGFTNSQHPDTAVRRQMMQQSQSEQPAVTTADGFEAQHAAALDQQSDLLQPHARCQQPVWHNARPWSPSLRQGNLGHFSMHTNPLAEPNTEATFAGIGRDDAGLPLNPHVQRKAAEHRTSTEEVSGPSFSLAELAAIDPNSL